MPQPHDEDLAAVLREIRRVTQRILEHVRAGRGVAERHPELWWQGEL